MLLNYKIVKNSKLWDQHNNNSLEFDEISLNREETSTQKKKKLIRY